MNPRGPASQSRSDRAITTRGRSSRRNAPPRAPGRIFAPRPPTRPRGRIQRATRGPLAPHADAHPCAARHVGACQRATSGARPRRRPAPEMAARMRCTGCGCTHCEEKSNRSRRCIEKRRSSSRKRGVEALVFSGETQRRAGARNVFTGRCGTLASTEALACCRGEFGASSLADFPPWPACGERRPRPREDFNTTSGERELSRSAEGAGPRGPHGARRAWQLPTSGAPGGEETGGIAHDPRWAIRLAAAQRTNVP